MAGARGGRGPRSTSVRGEILRQHLESVKTKVSHANVDQLVDHLRSTYPKYARLKLRPLTKRVLQILHSSGKANDVVSDDFSGNEQKESAHRKKRKQFDENEDKFHLLETRHVNKRMNNSVLNHSNRFSLSSAAFSSGSVGSLEDGVTSSGSDGIDLMKSMLRENYCAKVKKSGGVEWNRKVVAVNQEGELGIEVKEVDGLGSLNNDYNNGPKFKDLGGMSQLIWQMIGELLVPLCRPEVLQHVGLKPTTGVLLHGPPGCGKTTLALAFANEAGVPFYQICATDVLTGLSGASEENIRELFTKAHRTAPSIVFIDEIDAIASKRENLQREMDRRIVAQLMTCMDESYRLLKPVENEDSESSNSRPGYVLVIGATNRPDAIDPALRRPGRFDCEFGLGVPDEEARVQILTLLTRDLKVEDAIDLKYIARSTPGFVGADLAALVKKAGSLARMRTVYQRKIALSGEYGEELWRQQWKHEEKEKLRVTMSDFMAAAKMVQPSYKREGFSALPNVKRDDVGGLHLLRQEFDRHIVKRIKHPEVFKNFGMEVDIGILLYGPPGCGKTLIAKAVANEAGANFIHIKGPELLNKYVGESELAVRTIFNRARTCSPCILFFDEVDALTTNRGREGGRNVEGVVNQLLIELDGADQRQGVFVIGATNRPDVMDPAFLRPGRFGELLYVHLPSPEERGMILKALARGMKIDASVDLMAIGKDSLCENFSGADLSKLIRDATKLAMDGIWSSWHESSADYTLWTVQEEHFKIALRKISPSVSEEQIRYYQSLSERFGSGCK